MRAIDILRKCNDRGEVGYAHGDGEGDWPFVQECLDCGWLRYGYDASVGGRHDPSRSIPFQKRTIYLITAAGREELSKRLTAGQPK